MARPAPYPDGADPKHLHAWAVKVSQYLREKFAPQDTIPEIAPVVDEFAVGMKVQYPAAAPLPIGWLACDGALLLRAVWAELFDVLGTTFNTGGETGAEFRLPNDVSAPAGFAYIIKASS